MKKLIIATLLPILILLLNYVSLSMPANLALNEDTRNAGVHTWIHYEYFINPSTLVIDLRNVDADKSSVDVFRVLFQIAEEFEGRDFSKVYLSSKGKKKFYIQGAYFEELGSSYSYQNPMYLLRTFPENTFSINGTKAFSTWTGGAFGVFGNQMDDLNELALDWFIEDL
tara:strand:+ start:290 stop:796 length:507 start_codon:yes stop_codon:yes gene_type:complete